MDSIAIKILTCIVLYFAGVFTGAWLAYKIDQAEKNEQQTYGE